MSESNVTLGRSKRFDMSLDHNPSDTSAASRDASLLTAIAEGDEAAMAAFYFRHATRIYSVALRVLRNSNSAEKTFLAHDKEPRLQAASWIQLDVAKQIFAASGTDLDTEFAAAGKLGFKARELPIKLDATVISTVRNFQSPNVIGILPGVLKSAQDQAVIYTAHYDHLGVKADAKPGEDAIFNGAGDNGTGTAMIMEMARAVTSAKVMTPHSKIFAAVTAEEQGLLTKLFQVSERSIVSPKAG